MLKKDSFSKGYGLITDYIAAILHEMRNLDLTSKLNEYAQFDSSLSERDHLAIRKTFSGLIKLIYPDGNMTQEEAYELIDFAAEGRKRVKDQLYIVDETFMAEPAKFKYMQRMNEVEINVETLEKVSNALILPKKVQPAPVEDNVQPETPSTQSENESSDNATKEKRPRIVKLAEGGKTFRMGQTGVTYKDLFAAYLADANEITIEDPFIRTSWQVKNLMEFLTMLIDTREVDDLKIHLLTNEEESKIPELIDRLDDIKDDMATYGIEFDYKFKDFHDRCIKTDTGWMITMGRGLDIYDKYSPYSVAAVRQDKRKCKDFIVSYIEN